jgi:hypothetical protein
MRRFFFTFAMVLAVGMAGCPVVAPQADAGMPSDVGLDTAPPDAPCDCDDGVPCTIDSCDQAGRCISWSSCPGTDSCVVDEGGARCVPTIACATGSSCPSLPCNERPRCFGDICHYTWMPDQNADGVVDSTCGIGRCEPTVEVCNAIDDDCNGEVDDVPGLSSDPLHCGHCFHACSLYPRDICVDGECICTPDRLRCPSVERGLDTCIDPQTDALHCGRCGTACLEGARCIAGVCEYAEITLGTLNAPAWARLPPLVAPNGDVLVFTQGRPTQLTHTDGRPAQSIPPGESEFTGHAIRLDRNGDFVGITSIPDLSSTTPEWGVNVVAITNEGFFFGGEVGPGTYFGTTYATWAGMIGYASRTGEVAWVHPEPVVGVLTTPGNHVVALARMLGRIRVARFDALGARLLNDPRLDALEAVDSIAARGDEGFLVLTSRGPGNLGPGVPTSGRAPFALLFSEDGVPVEEVGFGYAWSRVVIDARADGSGWLVPTGVEATRRGLITHGTYGGGYSARFDGRGTASVDGRVLQRYRDSVEVIRQLLPAPRMYSAIARGAVWSVNSTPASSTLSRIDLPPLP